MAISAQDVGYSVGKKQLLSNISLKVIPGEILAIAGPNGAGKSTFLKLLAGDFRPSTGRIFYDQQDISVLTIENRAMCRSVMAQSSPPIFDFSVRDVVTMGWLNRVSGLDDYHFHHALMETVDKCDLSSLLNRKFNTLSGGEQRRAHFARALLQIWLPTDKKKNRYLLLDEPLANLDMAQELKILNIIKDSAHEGVGVILVLHDLNLAVNFADRIALFNQGQLNHIGSPEEVLTGETLSSIYGLPIKVSSSPLTLSYY